VRKVLHEALGAEKAGTSSTASCVAAAAVASRPEVDGAQGDREMLRQEHPQIIAIVLSYLDSEQAAQVLAHCPRPCAARHHVRVATLDGVHPSALNELDEVLEKQFSGNSGGKTTGFGGPKAAAEILNLVGAAQEGRSSRRSPRPTRTLGQKLQDLMFVFEDLMEPTIAACRN
jgi:flagellar motor switch protein FliG